MKPMVEVNDDQVNTIIASQSTRASRSLGPNLREEITRAEIATRPPSMTTTLIGVSGNHTIETAMTASDEYRYTCLTLVPMRNTPIQNATTSMTNWKVR